MLQAIAFFPCIIYCSIVVPPFFASLAPHSPAPSPTLSFSFPLCRFFLRLSSPDAFSGIFLYSLLLHTHTLSLSLSLSLSCSRSPAVDSRPRLAATMRRAAPHRVVEAAGLNYGQYSYRSRLFPPSLPPSHSLSLSLSLSLLSFVRPVMLSYHGRREEEKERPVPLVSDVRAKQNRQRYFIKHSSARNLTKNQRRGSARAVTHYSVIPRAIPYPFYRHLIIRRVARYRKILLEEGGSISLTGKFLTTDRLVAPPR